METDSRLRIVHLNENIKRSSAPYRLHESLKCQGCISQILTMHTTEEDDITVLKRSVISRILRKLDALFINVEEKIFYSVIGTMPFSYYHFGIDVTNEKRIKDADIIVLHWICGSFISLWGIERLKKMGKPMLIVCHDNWHFTGGCHVRLGCEQYQYGCGRCPQLGSKYSRDWSYRLLKKKQKVLEGARIQVISPSRWMNENVGKSLLFRAVPHIVIPNVIDSAVFKPQKTSNLRERYNIMERACVLAFGAVNATTTPYKGYKELMEALDIFEEKYLGNRRIEAVVFGSAKGDERKDKRIKLHYLGFLSESEMVELYNSVDIYVVPSLEDSFNNTVAECLACETPVVSFATGGIVDIIEHKINGYLAKYNCPEDLAKGIEWVSRNNNNNILGQNGRKKVIENYAPCVIGKKYLDVMHDLVRK